jgi:hypothetical protein
MSSAAGVTFRQFAEYGGYIGLLTAVIVVASLAAVVLLWRRLMKIEQAYQDKIQLLYETEKSHLNEMHERHLAMQREFLEAQAKQTANLSERYAQALSDTGETVRAALHDSTDNWRSTTEDIRSTLQSLMAAFVAFKDVLSLDRSRR